MTFDIILLTDTPAFPQWTRGYGAHRIASHLRLHGYSVLVIDFTMALTKELWEEICKNSIGSDTQMLGISTTWLPYRKPFKENDKHNPFPSFSDWGTEEHHVPYPNESSFTLELVKGNAKEWIDVAKKYNPKIKTIAGGAKIDWYRDLPVDHFISGLGENQILDYLTQPKRIWPTVINHDTKSNARDWGWTTSATSYTEYDLIKPEEILSLETTRGCRFKCKYCSFPLIGNKDLASYLKTEETLYNELLLNYERWGTTKYTILDDTFNDSNEKVELIHRISKRLPFELNFWAYIRVDMIYNNPEQMNLLLEAGLRTCFTGIESFDPYTSKLIGKGMSPEKRKQALYDMKACWGDTVGIRAGYIVGLPGESSQSIMDAAKWFAQESRPVNFSVDFIPLIMNPPGVFENHPTSEFDRDYEKYGYSIPDMENHLFWEKDDGTDIKTFEQAYNIAQECDKLVNGNKNSPPNPMFDRQVITDPVKQYFEPLVTMLSKY